MTDLQQGGNAPLLARQLSVAFDWAVPGGRDVGADASAFLLTAAGRVRGDADMIFYNQPEGAGGAIRFDAAAGGRGAFRVDLDRMPDTIERIVFCVTIHDAQARRQTLALLDAAEVAVTPDAARIAASPDAARIAASPDVGDPLRFRPALATASEAAMIFGELYRRDGGWKFRAVGQGFNGGLAPLARSFGIHVAEEPSAPPPPSPPSAPVRLGKVSLDKPGQTVSLVKNGDSYGEVVVNLDWSRGRRGFFGGGQAIDLDLGCLFELADGRKGAVQALGRAFGAFAQAPYVALSGDDRTGDVSGGETLRINGAHWRDIRRLIVFANIYDGVPNWRQTDGVVTVVAPDQDEIEVRLTEGRDDRRLCGIALIENDGRGLNVKRVVEYFRDQQMLDRQFDWGIRWVSGTKD